MDDLADVIINLFTQLDKHFYLFLQRKLKQYGTSLEMTFLLKSKSIILLLLASWIMTLQASVLILTC